MPRRRKKENAHRRRLAFAESPVENERVVITPVRADHPVHVNCVSICCDHCVSWVSPQFRGVMHSHGKRRQARRRHHSGPSTRLRSVNKENTFADSLRKGTRRQFPALRFLDDARETTTSSHHQQSLNSSMTLSCAHGPPRSCAEGGVCVKGTNRKSCVRRKETRRGDRGQRGRSVDGGDLEESMEEPRACDENWLEASQCHSLNVGGASSFDGSLCKDGSFLTETAILAKRAIGHGSAVLQRTSTQLSTSQNSDTGHSQSHRGRSKRHGSPQNYTPTGLKEPREKLNVNHLKDLSQGDATPSSCNSPSSAGTDAGSQRRKMKRKSYSSAILHSPLETENDSVFVDKNCNLTAVQKTVAMLHCSPSDMGNYSSPDVQLTDDQLFHGGIRSHASANDLQHEKAESDTSSDTLSKKCTPKRRHFCTNKRSTPKSQTRFCNTDSSSGVRRSVRLREKYLEALKYMRPCSPMSDRSSSSARNFRQNVLVADTPESEYGLPLRKRQLRRKDCM